METLEEGEDGATANRDMETWHQLPAEEDPSHFLGQTSSLLEADGLQRIALNSEGQMPIIGDSSAQPAADGFESLQLEMQDSCSSPALTLIPEGKAFLPSEFTLLHQTDLEFVPLRGSPDLSIASERFSQMSRLEVDGESNLMHRSHEQASLSQHHLGVMSAVLEDASSCCSLSQHSLSPSSNNQVTQIHDEEHTSDLENNDEWQKEGEEQTDADFDRRGTVCGLHSSVPVRSFQKLQGMDHAVASSSAVPSSLETVLSQTDVTLESQIKNAALAQVQDPSCTSTKEPQFRASESREQPQGGSSSLLSQRRAKERGAVPLSSRLSAISNITVRSTSKQTNDTTEHLRRQLQLHSDSSSSAPGGRNQTENKNTPTGQNITPASEGGVYMTGLQRALWNSGSHQAADGSFLTSQPVFQSTPAVLLGRGASAPAKLSPVYSHQDTMASSTQNSCHKLDSIPPLTLSTTSSAGVTLATSLDRAETHSVSHVQHRQEASSLRLDAPEAACEDASIDQPTVAPLPPTSVQQLKDQKPRLSAGRVHSLPSLSVVQKVDAWKANQSSSRSFYDNLSVHGIGGVPPDRKEQDSMSEAIKQQHPSKTSSVLNSNTSTPPTQTGSVVLSCADVEEAGGTVGSTSPSPFTHSHSHSSLGTVITPIQQDELQQNQNQLPLICTDAISPGFNSSAAESSLSSSGTNDQRPADDSGTGPLKTPALLSVDQNSGVNLNTNMSNAVSIFPGIDHVEQSFQASLGASSVASLEVDNYAPYWISRPGSPPRPPEFNIEDRIPLYLHNLGIDQSPSTILNPFTHRGPIREPEFSPTDLCTIKGSVGTPTKSIQPSDGDSLQKETLSSSSELSADCSASLTQLFIQKSSQQPPRPASSDSGRMSHFQTHNVPQGADTSHREGTYGLPAQVSLESASAPGNWESGKEGDSSLVGSETLQEIRRLLGHAESRMSGHFSMTSSPGSQCYSESDASFLSLRQNTQAYPDDSCLSVDGKISLLLACSSSDSALKDSSSSSSGPLELPAKSDHMNKRPSAHSQGREENPKSRDFHAAPRRAEPEGCSAADPDKMGPVSLSITRGNASSISDGQQQSQDQTENAGDSSSEISLTHSQTEAEMGVLSDASSEHSLATRVAKLLHSESSGSVVTSRSSTADPDESRAREWIMIKVSGGKCEALELSAEDRRRIEEIKRELLLHTTHTKSSSDSESSAQSSVGTVPQPAIGFTAVRSAENRLTEQLHRVTRVPLDSSVLPHKSLEDGVSQIAIEEGRSPQHTPSSQCLNIQDNHAAHSDTALESGTYTTQRSSDEWKLQTQMTNRVTRNERGKETVEKDKAVRDEDEHPENDRNDSLPNPETDQSVIRVKREFPPGLESGSSLVHKPRLSNNHLTPSVKLHQNTTQTSHTHHSDSPNTSKEVSGSSTSEDQQVSVSSETSLSKDRNAIQGQNTGTISGYSQITSRYAQAFTPPQSLAGPSRPLLVNTAAIPTLLPYKPHGSSELFYMPQTVPELSPNRSDTTEESSHPGSDDAVPPQFTPEVLGSRELVDNKVTPKHKEGIYSKRAKMNRVSTLSGKGLDEQRGNTGPHYRHTGFSKSVAPENEQAAERIEEREEFTPLHVEADYSTAELHPSASVQQHSLGTETLPLLRKTIRQKEHDTKAQDLGVEIGSSLDLLWHRFNEKNSLQEAQPPNDLEMSLLERLERLSRLLHGSSLPYTPKEAHSREEKGKSRRRDHEPRRTRGKDTTKKGREKVRGVPETAWEKVSLSTNQTAVEKEKQQQEKVYRYPAERDESASVSLETSSSQSTIDTQCLVRVFGQHRVSSGREGVAGSQALKPSDGLLKLYNTIKKQKRGQGKGGSENHLVSVACEISNTDDSTASDTLSSSSTYTPSSQRGNGCPTSSKRSKVKLVSRSIQAGELEIVVNGTRRDTRDVGTTFPSPGSARVTKVSSGACSEVKNSMSALMASNAAPVQSQPVLRRRVLNKHTSYPNGLSWFVSADELKWDARKENKPQTDAGQPEGQAWFEPYTRTQPWREPLRERHIQVEREKPPPEQKAHSDNDCGSKPSALVHLSLQEALELHRPEFVSRSRERMKRLCLLVEERKMQVVFNKEREELFNRPSVVQQTKAAPAPPPLPSKRVIPISEMIQRSKRIYAQLPEVQKRKEEEKRKAQYNTYRLNAQLFNKKITNHVLGRRAPWQ